MIIESITISYDETIFEEPFKPKKFGIEYNLKSNLPSENIDEYVKEYSHKAYMSVQNMITKYAPHALDYKNITQMQKGLPLINKKVEKL